MNDWIRRCQCINHKLRGSNKKIVGSKWYILYIICKIVFFLRTNSDGESLTPGSVCAYTSHCIQLKIEQDDLTGKTLSHYITKVLPSHLCGECKYCNHPKDYERTSAVNFNYYLFYIVIELRYYLQNLWRHG